jgi:Rrf2 family protein
MIQRTANYALRVAVWLARNADCAQTSREIAEATQIPSRYLYRVLQTLAKANLVRSQPGPGGGYSLLADPDEISLLEVVSAIAPVERIQSCPLGLRSHKRLCPLHQHLDDAYSNMEQALAKVTVGKVVRTPTKYPPFVEAKR